LSIILALNTPSVHSTSLIQDGYAHPSAAILSLQTISLFSFFKKEQPHVIPCILLMSAMHVANRIADDIQDPGRKKDERGPAGSPKTRYFLPP
jgi:hypothetical protein